MNSSDFTNLLNKPDAVNDKQILLLEKIKEDFPYFQSASTIHLKGLFKQDSIKYNQELKKTAAITTDRTVLFEFITSNNFKTIHKKIFEENKSKILEINVVDSHIISVINNDLVDQTIVDSLNQANHSVFEKKGNSDQLEKVVLEIKEKPIFEKEIIETKNIEEKLRIGKPIDFKENETHSFQEWLKISSLKPINREKLTPKKEIKSDSKKKKQLDIIDKFIEANPKIPAISKEENSTPITIKTNDTAGLMTETLAKVYLEQKKYAKAIQAYQILILKYPEKSSYFASLISDIKIIQQNNIN